MIINKQALTPHLANHHRKLMLFTLLQEVSQEMWGDNVDMMQDGKLTVAPIVGDCSTAWGFAEAGVFWTGQDPLCVDDVGLVCAGPFASLAKSTAAAAAGASSKRVSRSEDDEEVDVKELTYAPDMQYQRTKASTPTGLYNLHSTTLQAFEDKTAFVRSIDNLKNIAIVGLSAGPSLLLRTAVELAASYDFGAAPQPAFIIRNNKRSDPARLYRLRGSLAGLIRPTSDLAVVNCQCRLVTAGRTQGKTEYLHVFATREIQYGEELRVLVAPFIVL